MAHGAKFTALLTACLVIAGCYGMHNPTGQMPDRTVALPLGQIHVHWGQIQSQTGCLLNYAWYRPASPSSRTLVVLAHGFLRRKERLADLARTLAAAGIETVAVDLCNMRPWVGNHARNGFDLIQVADHLRALRVIYAGFSAGGLAALVAARADPRTLGALTLDLVDAQGLGHLLVQGFKRPIIGLFGDPGSCNAYGNGLKTLSGAVQARIERISGASHCDFESPTDWLCRAICEDQPQGAEQRRRQILRQALGAIQDLAGYGTQPQFASTRSLR